MSTREVNAYFQNFDHPLKAEMQAVRDIIMATDSRMDECIKWQSPTFTYAGNLASFNPRAKKHVSLMFHTGAQIPGNFPHLQGGGGTAKYMTFADMAEVKARKKELEAVTRAWIAFKSPEAGATKAKTRTGPAKKRKTGAKKKAVKKAKAKKKPAARKKTKAGGKKTAKKR